MHTEDNNNKLGNSIEPSSVDVIDNVQSNFDKLSESQSREVCLENRLNVTFDKAEYESTKETKSDVEDLMSDEAKKGMPVLDLDASQDTALSTGGDLNENTDKDAFSLEQFNESDPQNIDIESSQNADVEVIEDNESAKSVKADEKEPCEKEQTDEKSSVNEGKKVKESFQTIDVQDKKKAIKKIDSNKAVSKVNSAGKVMSKKNVNVDSKVSSAKASPRIGSKIADYIKKPNVGLKKEENIDSGNKKLSKNVVNSRKASMPDVKRTSITVMPVSVTTKDRRLSMPASRTNVTNNKTVGNKSVMSENGEDSGKKPIKRAQPKSKWDNIMSNINNGKEATKNKPKAEVQSRLNITKSQTKPNPNSAKSPASSTLRATRGSTMGAETRKPSSSPKPNSSK